MIFWLQRPRTAKWDSMSIPVPWATHHHCPDPMPKLQKMTSTWWRRWRCRWQRCLGVQKLNKRQHAQPHCPNAMAHTVRNTSSLTQHTTNTANEANKDFSRMTLTMLLPKPWQRCWHPQKWRPGGTATPTNLLLAPSVTHHHWRNPLTPLPMMWKTIFQRWYWQDWLPWRYVHPMTQFFNCLPI